MDQMIKLLNSLYSLAYTTSNACQNNSSFYSILERVQAEIAQTYQLLIGANKI